MDKLTPLRTAIDEILDDDHVTAMGDDSYEVRPAGGSEFLRVRRNDRGDWAAYFESGVLIPNAPSHNRPNEIVAWALS